MFRAGTTRVDYLHKRKDYKNICGQKRRKEKLKIKNIKDESEIWKYMNKYRKINKRVSKNISLEE